jgi:hypothetical protein
MNGGAAWIATMKGAEKLAIQKRYSAFANDTVNLYLYGATAGAYSFSFSDYSGFTSANIFLLDNLTNSLQNIQQNSNYSFSLASAGASANRFQLIFSAINTPLVSDNVVLTAQYQAGKVHLQWTAPAHEERNGFVLQSSSDGVSFKGTSEEPARSATMYSFIDTTKLLAKRFYRVKSLYKTGKTSYSKTVVMTASGQGSLSFVIHPNPVKDEMIIDILGQERPENLRIFTASGQVVFERSNLDRNGEQRLSVGHLGKGVYFLELSTRDGIKSIQKFAK